MLKKYEVIVVGGGVIGCSIAFHLAKSGKRVLLLEKNTIGSGSSFAAAGMLGVQSELKERTPIYELAKRSRQMFPDLHEELRKLTGIDIGYQKTGALKLALTDDDLSQLKHTASWQKAQGERVDILSNHEVVAHEPGLSDDIKGALFFPEEAQVSATHLVRALATGAMHFGAKITEHQEVSELLIDHGEIQGVRTVEGEYRAEHVVIASGVWSKHPALSPNSKPDLYPLKGEALSLKVTAPILSTTIFSDACYLTPETADEIYVGATETPYTYDTEPTVNGIYQLLGAARSLLPALDYARLYKTWAGLRPTTTTHQPYLGRALHLNNLWYAFGHHRNGVLLSAITGDIMSRLINAEAVDVDLTPFSPKQLSREGVIQ